MHARHALVTTPAEESAAIVADVAAQLRLRHALVAESFEQALFERLDRRVVEGTLSPGEATELERRLLAGSLLSLGGQVLQPRDGLDSVAGEEGERAAALVRGLGEVDGVGEVDRLAVVQ